MTVPMDRFYRGYRVQARPAPPDGFDPWLWTCPEAGQHKPAPYEAACAAIDLHALFSGRGVELQCCLGPVLCVTCAYEREEIRHACDG